MLRVRRCASLVLGLTLDDGDNKKCSGGHRSIRGGSTDDINYFAIVVEYNRIGSLYRCGQALSSAKFGVLYSKG